MIKMYAIGIKANYHYHQSNNYNIISYAMTTITHLGLDVDNFVGGEFVLIKRNLNEPYKSLQLFSI